MKDLSVFRGLLSSIYRRFSRQSNLRLASYEHVSGHLPSFF